MAATTVAEIRLVICPNCRKLLPEIADVPMYECGGCGTILQAKKHNVSNQNVISSTSETDLPQNLTRNDYSNDGSTSHEKKIIHSSSESQVEQSTGRNLASASSNAENYCYEKQGHSGVAEIGEPSNAGANDINETEPYSSGASNISSDAKRSSKMKSEESFKEEAEKPPKLKEKSYDSSKKHDRLRASAESCSQSIDSEEFRLDQSHGATPSTNLTSSTASSSDDGTENSLRDKLKGSHADLSQNVESNNLRSSTVSLSDDGSENGIRDKYRTLSRRTVRDQRFSGSFGTKAKEGAELLRSNTKDTDGGMSLDSEAFYSIRSWVESDKEGPSRSLSRRSAFFDDSTKNQIGSTSKFKNLELLKVMEELRDQLGRSYELKKKKKQRSQFNSAEDMFFNDYPSTYQRPQQHRLSQMPLSYLHCHLDPNLCCNNRLCTACSYNFCCHSLKARHPIQRANFSFPFSRNKARTTKSYCRPVSGGAPFVICQKCFEVLHMPADFLISTSRLHKLKCGACSEVMLLSFPALAHEVSQTSNESGNAKECTVSFSEEYGISFADTSSMGTEPVINVSKASSEMGDEEKASAATLHQLMGYSSARVLLFENSNSLNKQSASKAL